MPPTATLEADERPRVAQVPAPRQSLDDTATPAAGTATPAAAIASSAAAVEPDAPARERRRIPFTRRRLPQPPGRRAPLWLAALVAGALLAAGPGLLGGPDEVAIDASDFGLGVASYGELDDSGVRRGITEAEARARLDELAASRAAREPKTVLPLSGRLTTCYCMRWGQMHYGLDLAAPLGTPIYSASDGVVIEAGPAAGFGNAVYIQDEDGNVHIYGHMRHYSVSAGQLVHAGDQIALVGDEGFSTGPHLHYEIHRGGRDGSPLDPQRWLAERKVSV